MYITGAVAQELLCRNEYLVTEHRILRHQLTGRVRLSDGERHPQGKGHVLLLPLLGKATRVKAGSRVAYGWADFASTTRATQHTAWTDGLWRA